MNKIIILTKNKVAIVDDEDYERVNQHKWSAYKYNNRNWYATATIKQKNIRLHRFILNLKDGEEADHINNDGLDNRKCNLRICSRSENLMNKRKPSHGETSKFKGVSWNNLYKKWQVYIKVNGKNKFLGNFKKETEAAQKYNEAAIKYYGEFACINKECDLFC